MKKQVAYDEKENCIIIEPGFGGIAKTVMSRDDFLNICSDFAFQELQSVRFDDFVRRYFDNKDEEVSVNGKEDDKAV